MVKLRLFAFGAIAATIGTPADAAVIVSISQVGSNVVATAAGSINLTGLTSTYPVAIEGDGIAASGALILFNLGGTTRYIGFPGPANWGGGAGTDSTSTGGSLFAFQGRDRSIFLPIGYLSGTPFSSTQTFANHTLASLGLIQGQYVYRSSGDSVIVNVGTVVPEPATWVMMLGGVSATGCAIRRRRKVEMRVTYAG